MPEQGVNFLEQFTFGSPRSSEAENRARKLEPSRRYGTRFPSLSSARTHNTKASTVDSRVTFTSIRTRDQNLFLSGLRNPRAPLTGSNNKAFRTNAETEIIASEYSRMKTVARTRWRTDGGVRYSMRSASTQSV